MHPWNFAIKRAELAASATAPTFRYLKAYPLPSDCLRVLTVYKSHDWKVEVVDGDRCIIGDLDSPIYLKYVADITDDTKWDPSFQQAFVYKLAANMSYALVPDMNIRRDLLQQFLIQLDMARTIDGTEDIEDDWGSNLDELVGVRSDYDVWDY